MAILLAALLAGQSSPAQTTTLPERMAPLAKKGDVKGLMGLTNDIKKLKNSDPTAFFNAYDQLTATLEAIGPKEHEAVPALKLATEQALSAPCPAEASSVIGCLQAKQRMVQRLTGAFPDDTSLEAKITANLLGEIRAAMIPNYKEARILLNVAPPLSPKSSIGYAAGMDPAAIQDPNARAAYLKAIDDNNQNRYRNQLQLRVLPDLNQEITPLCLKYGKALVALKPAEAGDIAQKTAQTAHLTEQEAEILK